MRESLSESVLEKCPKCGQDGLKEKVFCSTCGFNVNGVETGGGVIVKFAHITKRMKTNAWDDDRGRAEMTLKMWEEQGQKFTQADKKFWKGQLENNPHLTGAAGKEDKAE